MIPPDVPNLTVTGPDRARLRQSFCYSDRSGTVCSAFCRFLDRHTKRRGITAPGRTTTHLSFGASTLSVHQTGGTTVPTFADLGLPEAVVTTLADLGITTPFPIQAATLPDSLAGRDVLGRGRTGSGQDLRLPAADGGPARNQPDQACARPSAGTHPRAHPRARRADRCGAGTAGRGDEPALGHRLRRGQPAAADRQAAPGRRHRHRLPRPAGGSREIRPCGSVRGRDHRARRGRPHGRSRLPASGQATAGPNPAPLPADAVLGHPRRRRRRAGQALPARPGGAQRRFGAVAGVGHGPPRAARRQRGADQRADRPGGRAGSHHRLRPHQARRRKSLPDS